MHSDTPALGASVERLVAVENFEGDVFLAEGLCEEETAEAGADDQDVGTST